MKERLSKAKGSLRGFWRNVSFSAKSFWQVNKWLFMAKVLIYISQGILPIYLSFLGGQILDSVVTALNMPVVDSTPTIRLLALFALVGFAYDQSMRLARYVEWRSWILYEKYITTNLHAKFAMLDHSHYEDAEFNKQVNKIQNFMMRIVRFNDELFYLLVSIVELAAAGFALIFLNPYITVFLLAGIIPTLIVQLKSSKARWRVWDEIDHDKRYQNAIGRHLLDTVTISEIKIFNLPEYLGRLWQTIFTRTENQRLSIERRATMQQSIANVVEVITRFGISVWLLMRVLARIGFSIGSFTFYRNLVNNFANASSRLVVGLQNVSETGLYVKDYLNFMELKPKVVPPDRGRVVERKKPPTVEFINVSFKYPGSKQYVLKNLNLTISPGEDIAIVGENGAGKTTLIKLLMRFYDVSEGEILVNGRNIKELDISSWYRQVGVLFQEFNKYRFFKAKRNIGIGNVSKVSDITGIKAAAKQAGATKFIESLPDKYDTVLDKSFKSGTELSGGQWQRIALARAFFRNANILILDEPTAAIDAKGEYEIFQKITRTQKDKTTIIISHRFSTVRNANKIFVIERGQIREQGSHQELMRINGGTYKHMFELQAEGYR